MKESRKRARAGRGKHSRSQEVIVLRKYKLSQVLYAQRLIIPINMIKTKMLK